jgi:hypothetical protein
VGFDHAEVRNLDQWNPPTVVHTERVDVTLIK